LRPAAPGAAIILGAAELARPALVTGAGDSCFDQLGVVASRLELWQQAFPKGDRLGVAAVLEGFTATEEQGQHVVWVDFQGFRIQRARAFAESRCRAAPAFQRIRQATRRSCSNVGPIRPKARSASSQRPSDL
jgi:hypothetical protein